RAKLAPTTNKGRSRQAKKLRPAGEETGRKGGTVAGRNTRRRLGEIERDEALRVAAADQQQSASPLGSRCHELVEHVGGRVDALLIDLQNDVTGLDPFASGSAAGRNARDDGTFGVGIEAELVASGLRQVLQHAS